MFKFGIPVGNTRIDRRYKDVATKSGIPVGMAPLCYKFSPKTSNIVDTKSASLSAIRVAC